MTLPRKAATVAVIRDNADNIEVLLMRRQRNDLFLPGYHVFPGGAVDAQDYEHEFPQHLRSDKTADFNNDYHDYYTHIICGIRETFEESGILFASDIKGEYPVINSAETVEKYLSYRQRVHNKQIQFRDMLVKENLVPAIRNFFYIDRWITPSVFPIRYDTRFFAALAPACQEISHDNTELVEHRWVRPSSALELYGKGGMKLVMPTVTTLELLSRFRFSSDVTAYLHERN